MFAVAVSCYYLIRANSGKMPEATAAKTRKFAVSSIKIASIVGLVATLLTAYTGDNSAYMVAKTQPMKLAAMEALYDGEEGAPLTAVALINPFQAADYALLKSASAGGNTQDRSLCWQRET